jgi:sugar-specific transcriptional regulator TrmB
MVASEDALNLLKRIGLNQYESRIYTALLAAGSSTAGELSEHAEVPRSRVYDVLTSLEKKGFAVIQVGRPVKYLAVAPQEAVSRVKSNFEEDFNRKINSLEELEDTLSEELGPLMTEESIEPEEVVGVLRGRVNIYNQLKQMIGSADNSIVKMTTDAGISRLDKHCKSALANAKKRGVKARIAVNVKNSRKAVNSLKSHAELKKISHIDGRFFVKDGKEAILITSPEDIPQTTGLWVKNEYLAGWLEKLFEHAWEKGEEVGA